MTKALTTDHIELDIRWINRRYPLNKTTMCETVSWFQGEDRLSSINVQTEQNSVTLRWRVYNMGIVILRLKTARLSRLKELGAILPGHTCTWMPRTQVEG